MFLLLFHSHEVRDVGTYGSITIINGVVNYNISEDQRLQCIIQACREIMIYIDMLTKLFGRSTLSYAVWYVNEGHKLGIHMNNNNYNETYSDFISLITCRQITATQFILPNVTWQIVRFVSVKK